MAQINFKPSWKQHLAWQALEDSLTEELVYGGAAGGGKSYLGCWWKIYRRQRYAKTRGLIGRAVLKNIKESTLITYFKVLAEWGLEAGKDYRFNATDMYIEFSNGSREVFKELSYLPSDPEYQRLGSSEYTDIWIEEDFDVIPEKAADIAKTRIRWMLHDYGLIPKILFTCNPGYNWLRNKYIKDIDNNPVQLKPYQKFIQAKVTDNPDRGFVELYKKSLENISNDYDRQRLLDGDWDAVERTGAEFYHAFDTMQHVQDISHEYDPEHPLHITFDFNLAPHMTLNIHQVWGKKVVQIDEICLEAPKNSTPATIKAFCEKYKRHQAEVFVYGDPAGKQGDTRNEQGHNDYSIIQQELRKAGLRYSMRVAQSAPSVSMRGLWFNDILLGKRPGISFTVDRRCSTTVADYQKVKKDADGTKNKKKVTDAKSGISYEPYGHSTDANDYMFCQLFADDFRAFQKGEKPNAVVVRRTTVNSNRF
jgi:phage terminase large subunit